MSCQKWLLYIYKNSSVLVGDGFPLIIESISNCEIASSFVEQFSCKWSSCRIIGGHLLRLNEDTHKCCQVSKQQQSNFFRVKNLSQIRPRGGGGLQIGRLSSSRQNCQNCRWLGSSAHQLNHLKYIWPFPTFKNQTIENFSTYKPVRIWKSSLKQKQVQRGAVSCETGSNFAA